MFSLTRRVRVLPTAVGGALALALTGLAAGPAIASTDAAAGMGAAYTFTVTGGTATVDMTKSYIANMAANDIKIVPVNTILVDSSPATYTITTWNLNGGQVDSCRCAGTVHLDGGSLVDNTVTGGQLNLTDLRFDIAANTLDYTLQEPSGPVVIHALDLAGDESWSRGAGGALTFSASEMFVDPNAAAAMDSALSTNAFTDTGLFGSFTTTFTVQ